MRHSAALASFLLVLVPTAAWSGEDDLQVSSDGVSWSNALTSPLFELDLRWVPGDSEVRSFYARNRGPSSGTMSLRLDVLDDADELFAGEDLVVEARSTGSGWQRLRRLNSSYALGDQPIASDARVRVDIRVSFDPRSTNETMRRRLRAQFIVVLADAGATPDPDGNEGLPSTGSPAQAWWLWAGAALIGLGIALTTRRAEKEDAHVDHRGTSRRARRGWLTSTRVRAMLSLGVALGVGAVGTFASWTDDVTVTGTTFTAGTLDLLVNGGDPPAAYTTLNVASNMVPGNTVVRAC